VNFWSVWIIIGIVFLGAALYIWISPIIHDVNAIKTQDKLNLAYSKNVIVSGTELNFITYVWPQKISIHYSYHTLDEKNGFVAIDLPYTGYLSDSPTGWKLEKFPETKSNVIYKNTTCAVDEPCSSDSGDITFVIDGNLDSIRSFRHFIQIPFATGPSNSEINSFHNDLAGKPSFNRGWDTNGITKLRVYLDHDEDQWNTQPHSDLDSFKRQNGDVHIILDWQITDSRELIIADYTSPSDRFNAEARPVLFAVLIGFGITFIVANVQIQRSERGQGFLRTAIHTTEARINHTLQSIQNIVHTEHQETRQKIIEENQVYKVSLLHDLDGIVMSIYQTLSYAKEKKARILKPSLRKIIEYHSEEYKYWAERISSINTNTYVPAKIRSKVSMLLHQGIKPIYSPEIALKYDFLEKTFINLLNDILNSDYMVKDSDPSVKHYLKGVISARDLLLTLKTKK